MKTGKDIEFPQSLVVDASVMVKLFVKETGSEAANKYFGQVKQGYLSANAPSFLIYEVMNALWKGKRFDRQNLAEASLLFKNIPIIMHHPEDKLLTVSLDFAVEYDLSFYDAVYAALAYVLNIPLFTANPRHHGKVKEIKILSLK